MASDAPVLLLDLVKGYGGAEVRVQDVAVGLHGRYPYAVGVLHGSPLQRKLEAAGLNVVPVPYGRSDPRVLPFLRQVVHRGGYRIIDAHNVQSQFWAWLLGRVIGGVRTIATVHSDYRAEHSSIKGRLYELVLRASERGGADFVAICSMLADHLHELGVPSERIVVIPNALRPLEAPLSDPEPFATLGWPADAYVVALVARLEPSKGPDVFIDAVRRIAPAEPRLRCLLVGEGRLRPSLEASIREAGLLDRVRLAGFVQNVPSVLRHSQAFCLSSNAEGLPYALMEAMECGLPPIVTTVGEMPRLLEHGKTGYLVPPGDPAALAEGLSWLIHHPEEGARMGAAAQALVRESLNMPRMIDGTLAHYRLR